MDFILLRFSDFCELYSGGDAPDDVRKSRTVDYPFPIYSNGIENEGLYGFGKKSTMPADCLTISARGTVGKVFYRKEPFLPIVRLVTIIPNKETVDPLYLYYLLQCVPIDGFGTSQQQITIPYLNKRKIRVCGDWAMQKKIADVLSKYDSLIEANNKRIKVLEQIAENLYKEWFVRFRFPGYETAEFENGLPKGWEEKRLGDFGITLDSGSRPSGGIDDSIVDGIPSLGAEAVNGLAEFDCSNVKLIPVDYYERMKHGKNTGNDILVYKDGAYIGKVTIFRNEFPFKEFAVNEHVFLLNAVDKTYQNYLYFTLHLPEYFVLMQNLNRNAAQPGLSKPDMNRIKITVPNKETVLKFNSFVEPILSEVFEIAKQNRNLTKQRDLLLPRLMNGKLEV